MLTHLRAAISIFLLALLTGCGDGVSNPISPQAARKEVVDAAHEVMRSLKLQDKDLLQAQFRYEACSDDGKGPFRGKVSLSFWIPGDTDRSHRADPALVLGPLRQQGWGADSDFHSHDSGALKKNGVVLSTFMTVPPDTGPMENGHAMMDVLGECRDTTDHSNDPAGNTDIRGELLSG
jgi:hypothetical protein